jgi:hypothetical protein
MDDASLTSAEFRRLYVTKWPPDSSEPRFQGLKDEPLDTFYDHDPRHPEHERKDLIWVPNGWRGSRPANYKELREKQGRPAVEEIWLTDTHEICSACGWTDENQMYSSYTPRVRIHHT